MAKIKKVVVIGGGTGTYVALKGLKNYPLKLSAIVTTMDSGGSTGRLRDQLGVLPPGDLRQALVALSSSEKIWRDLFTYRFNNGDLDGHNFGNIFLSALEKITGSMDRSIRLAAHILDSKGEVIPVSLKKAELCVELADGKIIEGEKHIDNPKGFESRAVIKRAFLKPNVFANKKAIESIENANLVLFGPGDLYTSIIPNLIVSGIKEALKKSKSLKVFAVNLMTKYGQTTNYTAKDHIKDLEKYLGRNVLNCVIINSRVPNKDILDWYKFQNEVLVKNDIKGKRLNVLRCDLLSQVVIRRDPSDKTKRSLIRHDPKKLAKCVYSLL